MSKPRRKPPARKESRGRTYTISCTDEQWAAIQDGAERAGKNVSTWFVECALTVDPWPRKHRRLVLNEREQRRHARAVAASARNLGADEADGAGDVGAELGALMAARLCGMARRSRREPSPRRSYRTRRRRRPPRRRRARKVAGPKRRPRQRRRASCSLPTTISKRPRSPHCGSCARRVLASGPGRCRRVRPRGRGVANAGPPNTARERRSGSSPAWSDPAADAHAAAGPALPLRQRPSRSRAMSAVIVSRWRSMPLCLDPNSRPFIFITGPRRRIRG